MLLLSLFEDVGQGTTRLKQLLDGYLLLRQMDAVTDWDAFSIVAPARTLPRSPGRYWICW